MPEVDADELCVCTDFDAFLRRYGNPVILKKDGQRELVCMAREYYEHLVWDVCTADEGIKYWIYEFEMSEEARREYDRACTMCEMTHDEFLEAAVRDALKRAETDPEGFNAQKRQIEEHPEQYSQIQDKENYSEEFLYNAICYFEIDPEKVVVMLNELPAEIGTELAASFQECREKTREILRATLAEHDFAEPFHSPEIEDIVFYQLSHGLPVS